MMGAVMEGFVPQTQQNQYVQKLTHVQDGLTCWLTGGQISHTNSYLHNLLESIRISYNALQVENIHVINKLSFSIPEIQ
jgi:hypothetical protein